MKNSFVAMGTYYSAEPYGLVRTVCRAIDVSTGEVMTTFVQVGKGGKVSEVFVMPEMEFESIFMK